MTEKALPTMEDLVALVREHSAEEPYSRQWKKILDEKLPGWESLVKSKENWPKIEELCRDDQGLAEVFLKAAGLELALKWFKEGSNAQEQASKNWLRDRGPKQWNDLPQEEKDWLAEDWPRGVMEILDENVWQDLSRRAKRKIISWAFEEFLGEPFETTRRINRSFAHLFHELEWTIKRGRLSRLSSLLLDQALRDTIRNFISLPFVPHPELRRLEAVIRKAKDEDSLVLFEKLMADRRKAAQRLAESLKHLWGPEGDYEPTPDERELIARLLWMARRHGYGLAPFPKIRLSFEIPPLFATHPELEREIVELPAREELHENEIPRDPERPRPEWIDVEEVLGLYHPEREEITLFIRGISWAARRLRIEERWLRAVVLIHELAHWLTHRLPGKFSREWPTEAYKLGSRELHETLAQLLTWWVAEEVAIKSTFGQPSPFEGAFIQLNRCQSKLYRTYQEFKDTSKASIFQSLEHLRNLGRPAGLEDLKQFSASFGA